MDIGDEIHTRPPYKTRSASISAPGHSSMETIINPPSGGGGTPEGGTPGYRRRRQATRSQSARITAPRNVRKKAIAQQAQQNLSDCKSHCTSEPRLNETETPQTHRRYGSTRRATHNSARRGQYRYNYRPVSVLGEFWSRLIDEIQDPVHVDVQARMKSWLKTMIANKVLVEPFDTIPEPVDPGALPILPRYNYSNVEIQNNIAVKLGVPMNETVRTSPIKTIPRATSTAIKQRLGLSPVVTEETTITQSLTYETPEGTVTEIKVVEVDKPPVTTTVTRPKKFDPFAMSSNWVMDEQSSPTSVIPGRQAPRKQVTSVKVPPVQETVAPRKKHDPFAMSSDWMMDEPPSPPPVTSVRRGQAQDASQQATPTRAPPVQEVVAPRKKHDPFAMSSNWMMDESPSPPKVSTVKKAHKVQEAPLPSQAPEQSYQPRKKIDPFAPSVNWYGDESPKKSVAERPKTSPQKRAQPPPVQAPVEEPSYPYAPRKRIDPFAPSVNWYGDESPKKSVTERPRTSPQKQSRVTPVKLPPEQPPMAPVKKRNDFASSLAFGDPESPKKSSGDRYKKPSQQMATVQQMQAETGPRPKRNDFASSLAFGSPEKPSLPKIAEETTVQQSRTIQTSDGITSESRTVITNKTQTGTHIDSQIGINPQRGSAYRSTIGFGDDAVPPIQSQAQRSQHPVRSDIDSQYQSRRGDAYKSSIGFGSAADTPPPRRTRKTQQEPISTAPSVEEQGAAQIYQSRRVNNNNSVRKSNVYLDVPTMNMQHLQVSDPDIVRTFSASNKGVVNRGDSFRRRRSRSNSLAPISPMQAAEDLMVPSGPEETFKVLMLGGAEVGKAALLAQFKTSECINAYDEGGRDSPGLQNVSIILNGIESELQFVKETLDSKEELESADAFLVVYSVVDKPSFQKAEQIIIALTDMDLSRTRPIILVANKIDLARSRAISSQDGRCLACTHRTKFIEVSVGINHNVDELLAGTLTQIRLKKEQNALQASKDPSGHWYKNRNVVRASMKARQMVSWIFGKEDSKFRNCENLQVL